MSADLLREAAATMRQCARAATPGPWISESSGPTGPVVMDGESRNALDHVAQCKHYRAHFDADHIASWHPIVALAAADLLYDAAEDFETSVKEQSAEGATPDDALGLAEILFTFPILLARAYLGRAA